MPSVSPQTVKLKSTLRLLVSRLRIAQQKDTSLSIVARREMGELLSQSREASARIRVENIIHTDVTVELMEILELYAELLQARAGLLDVRDKNIKEGQPQEDTGLEEAAASIIFAAPRLARDIKELGIVRAMLIERLGKDFAAKVEKNVDDIVPTKVTDKLKVDPPKQDLVQAYLEEIARTYKVDWPAHKQELADAQAEVDAEVPGTPKKIDLSGLSNDTGAKSPVSVAPPGARTDNPNPKVKLPGGQQVKPAVGALGAPPTVDDLAKRFQALKR